MAQLIRFPVSREHLNTPLPFLSSTSPRDPYFFHSLAPPKSFPEKFPPFDSYSSRRVIQRRCNNNNNNNNNKRGSIETPSEYKEIKKGGALPRLLDHCLDLSPRICARNFIPPSLPLVTERIREERERIRTEDEQPDRYYPSPA